jgi:flagellar hook-associated protein 2
LNGGSAFNLSIASPAGASATTVAVTIATPAGIVAAINAADVNGLKAYTMNTKAAGATPEISIMLEGKTGAANTFTVTDASSISSPSALVTQNTGNDIQAASNLKLVVNRLSNDDTSEFVFRDNNSPSDVIAGVQINFKTASGAATNYTMTNIVIAEDRAAFSTAMEGVQTAYNDLIQTVGVLDGTVESESTYSGNLKKDRSTLRGIVQGIRNALSNDSSTPSDPIKSMRQLGVGFDLNGNLTIQKTTLDAAVISNFSDITKMLTANTDDQSHFSAAAKGLAQDVVNVVDNFNSVTGIVKIKTDSNTKLISDLTAELESLQAKYESSKRRYLQQFAAMESLVQSSKSTGEYLTQQFKAMNGGD